MQTKLDEKIMFLKNWEGNVRRRVIFYMWNLHKGF